VLKIHRFLPVIFLLAILLILITLQDSGQQDGLLWKFDRLPNADLRSLAENEWQAGHRGSALAILDYIIDNHLPDAPGAASGRDRFIAEMQKDQTPLGRIQTFGYGARPGKVVSFESLAGSALADFFVVGDLRDLIREGFFADKPDELIMTLSGVGIITTAFPLAEPAINLTKVAKRTGALTEPMQKYLLETFKHSKNAPQPVMIARVQEAIMPFYQLARKCRTWSEFEIMMQCARHPEQIKVLTKIISASPANAGKLTQILSVLGPKSREQATRSLDLIMQQGQKGMDSLYAALRKGPQGIQFVLDHPAFWSRSLKNVEKTRTWGVSYIQDIWQAWAIKYRYLAVLIKYLLIAAVAFLLLLQIARLIPSRSLDMPGGNVTKRIDRYYAGNFYLALIGGGIALSCLIFFLSSMTPDQPESMTVLPETGPGTSINPVMAGSSLNVWSITLMTTIIVWVQGCCYWIAYRKIRALQNDALTEARMKLQRLENLYIFFDLPLYCGLALTIFAFILITAFGAEVSRFLAYAATLVGIIVAVILRVFYLYPLREQLIREGGN
jgi:hypothetical protein